MIEYVTEETKLIPLKDRRRIEKKVLPEYYKGIRTHKRCLRSGRTRMASSPGTSLCSESGTVKDIQAA